MCRVLLLISFLALACKTEEPPQIPPAKTELEGVWSGVAREREGPLTLNVSRNEYFLSGPGGQWFRGTFTLRPSGKPGQADFLIQQCDCRELGMGIHALYEFKDGVLTVVASKPGSANRPTSLADTRNVRLLRFVRVVE